MYSDIFWTLPSLEWASSSNSRCQNERNGQETWLRWILVSIFKLWQQLCHRLHEEIFDNEETLLKKAVDVKDHDDDHDKVSANDALDGQRCPDEWKIPILSKLQVK